MTKHKSFWVKTKFSTDFNLVSKKTLPLTFALDMTDKITTRFEKGLVTGMILIDLQKAFYTIDPQILIKKIKYLGFSKNVIAWFKSISVNENLK